MASLCMSSSFSNSAKMTRSQKRKMKAHRKLVRDLGREPGLTPAASLHQNHMADSCICDALLSDAIGNAEAMRVIVGRHLQTQTTLMGTPCAEEPGSCEEAEDEWVQVTGLEEWAVVEHGEVQG